MARQHDFTQTTNNGTVKPVSYFVDNGRPITRTVSTIPFGIFSGTASLMVALGLGQKFSDIYQSVQRNHLKATLTLSYNLTDSTGNSIITANDTDNPSKFRSIFGNKNLFVGGYILDCGNFIETFRFNPNYFYIPNKWGSDSIFENINGSAFLMIDKNLGEEFEGIDVGKCFNAQPIFNDLVEKYGWEQVEQYPPNLYGVMNADWLGSTARDLYTQYNATFDYTPYGDRFLLNINGADPIFKTALSTINYFINNYSDESATPNYYNYNPVKAPHFTYNVRVDATNSTAKIDVVKDFSKVHYGTIIELPKIHLTGLGYDITLGCGYKFYLNNVQTGNKRILLETEEDNSTHNFSFRVPLLQLVSNTQEYINYIRGVDTSTHTFANNISCELDYYCRVLPPIGEKYEAHTIIDTITGESAITYGYAIPPSASESASSYNVIANTTRNTANPFYAWVSFLCSLPVIQAQGELYDKLVQLRDSSAFVVANEDMTIQYVTPPEPTPEEDDDDYNTPEYDPTHPEVPTDPTPIRYDPTPKTTATIPTPELIPDHKVITSNVVALYTIYRDTGTKVGDLATFLWGNDFDLSSLKLVNNNPIENIISLRRSPFEFSAITQSNVLLGNVDTGVSMNVVSEDYEATVGTFKIEQAYGNFLDFAPFTIIDLYLPFVGYVELDPIMVMNKSCTLKVYVDALNMVGKYQLLTYNNILVGEWEFQGGEEIPISASNNAQHMASIIGSLASTVVSVATGHLGGALNGLGNALTSQVHTTTSGKPTANTSLLTSTEAFLRISYPKYQENIKYGHTIGYMCQRTHVLNELTGFTKLNDTIDLQGINATEEEKETLRGILTNGFYI